MESNIIAGTVEVKKIRVMSSNNLILVIMTGISVVGGGSRSPYRMPGCLRVVTFIALFLDLDQKNTTGGAYQTGIALKNTDLSLVSDDSWTDSTAPGSCIAAVRAG